jgi:hypothetical protein
MSVLTGKCDFYDSVEMIGDIEDFLGDKADIYVRDIRIPNVTEKDLVPYYPFIISSSYGSKEYNVVHLTRYSYIDYEEYDRLTMALNDFKRYYRKCKRTKHDFKVDECLRITAYHNFGNKDTYLKLAQRVADLGEKADIFGLSLEYYDKYYRAKFYKLLLEHGYSEMFANNWVYKRKEQLWYERHYEDR